MIGYLLCIDVMRTQNTLINGYKYGLSHVNDQYSYQVVINISIINAQQCYHFELLGSHIMCNKFNVTFGLFECWVHSVIQGRGCYSTFGWVPSIASLIILLQLLLSLVIFSNVIIICSGLFLERFS